MKKKDSCWFWLLVFICILFWGSTIDTLPYLSPDDMGKDLYPFEMTLRGQWPCRDYYWQYGPLMLFYYSFWLAVGGIHLVSVRLGYAVLYLFSSILCFRTLRLLVSPPIAFLASLGFLIQGMHYPFYNFNHIGALPFLLMSIFSLWKYFSGGSIRWRYVGTLALAGMTLVKWNTGLVSFFAFLGSLLLFDRFSKKGHFSLPHFILPILIFGVMVFAVYRLQYGGCRGIWVKECLGVINTKFLGLGPWVHFKHLIQWFFVWDQKRLGWLGFLVVFGIFGLLGLKKRGRKGDEKEIFPWVIGSLFLYGFFSSTDYFLAGHIYRLDFWSFPILVLLMGFAAQSAGFLLGPKMKSLLFGLLLMGVLILPLQSVREAFAARVPERYLDFPRGRVYVVKETLSTVEAIKKGTHFILENTRPDQEILTLPKDPLYCFLSGRRHATRELMFEGEVFKGGNQIVEWEAEEKEWIHQLEIKQVPLVLLSNRDESNGASTIPGMGYFGKTHLRRLGKYISAHYQEVQTFGTWEAANPRISHAVKILQRRN